MPRRCGEKKSKKQKPKRAPQIGQIVAVLFTLLCSNTELPWTVAVGSIGGNSMGGVLLKLRRVLEQRLEGGQRSDEQLDEQPSEEQLDEQPSEEEYIRVYTYVILGLCAQLDSPDGTFVNRFARCIDGYLRFCCRTPATIHLEHFQKASVFIQRHKQALWAKANCNDDKRRDVERMCNEWKTNFGEKLGVFIGLFQDTLLRKPTPSDVYNRHPQVPKRVMTEIQRFRGSKEHQRDYIVVDGANVMANGQCACDAEGRLLLTEDNVSYLTKMIDAFLSTTDCCIVVVISERSLPNSLPTRLSDERIKLVITNEIDDDLYSMYLFLEWSLRDARNVHIITNDKFGGQAHLDRFGPLLLKYIREHSIPHNDGWVHWSPPDRFER